MEITNWISNNYIEIFGAVTGIVYVFLEIRQNIWLWPVGIITSGVYVWIFFTGKLYADTSLQGYYLIISFLGWYWWIHGRRRKAEGGRSVAQGTERRAQGVGLQVSHINLQTGIVLAIVFVLLNSVMWLVLDKLTDSPVPGWDSFITSLSIIATWMLARKIFEHWYLWIVVNFTAAILFYTRQLYPTVILYIIYCVMSFAGLAEWKKSLTSNSK